MNEINECRKIREKILDLAYKSKESHLWSCFSIVEFMYVIYQYIKKNDDDFILSKWHAALAYYVILWYFWYISTKTLDSYCKNWSYVSWHPSKEINGISLATGALGIWLSVWIGYAIHNNYFNNHKKTFVLLWDWELNEGSVREGLMYAWAKKIKNLVMIIDNNDLQATTRCDQIIPSKNMFGAISKLWWKVSYVDGHDTEAIKWLIKKCYKESTWPIAIILKTTKWKGINFMENEIDRHHKSMTDEEYLSAKKNIYG